MKLYQYEVLAMLLLCHVSV